jgi:hypothetical protein
MKLIMIFSKGLIEIVIIKEWNLILTISLIFPVTCNLPPITYSLLKPTTKAPHIAVQGLYILTNNLNYSACGSAASSAAGASALGSAALGAVALAAPVLRLRRVVLALASPLAVLSNSSL